MEGGLEAERQIETEKGTDIETETERGRQEWMNVISG